jgi:hypothetical protein
MAHRSQPGEADHSDELLLRIAQQMRDLTAEVEQVGRELRTIPFDYTMDKGPASSIRHRRTFKTLLYYKEQATSLVIAAFHQSGAFEHDAPRFRQVVAEVAHTYNLSKKSQRPVVLGYNWITVSHFWAKTHRGIVRSNHFSHNDAEHTADILREMAHYLEASPQERHTMKQPPRKRPRLSLHLRQQMRPLPPTPPSANEYRSLDAALQNPDRVYRLLLRHHKLKELPPEIGRLQQLHYLVADFNPLHTLPETIGELRNLRTLMINWNHLAELPATIGNLRQLELFEAAGARYRPRNAGLTELPAWIGNLTALHSLNLTQHYLGQLPPEIGNLVTLEELRLSRNRLTELPSAIGKLQQLRLLELGNNPLIALPDSIGNLTRLESLTLSGRQMTSLPPTIRQWHAIQYINLRNTAVKELPVETGNWPSLQYLMLPPAFPHTEKVRLQGCFPRARIWC